MGSFGGHTLPGTCFMILGLWMPIQLIWSTYHRSRGPNSFKRMDSLLIILLAMDFKMFNIFNKSRLAKSTDSKRWNICGIILAVEW